MFHNIELSQNNQPDNTFVVNQANNVLLNLPSGKPNTKAPQPKRVLQPIQKGWSCCTYYAMKINVMQKEGYLIRQKEPDRKQASLYRKALTQRDAILHNIQQYILLLKEEKKHNNFLKNPGYYIKASIENYQEEGKKATSSMNQAIYSGLIDFLNIYSKNLSQDIFSFHKTYQENFKSQKWQQAATDFLKSLNIDIEISGKELLASISVLTKQAALINPKLSQVFESNSKSSLWVLRQLVNQQLHQVFDLKPVTWSPANKIEDLITSLKTGKAMIVSGFYGQLCYSKPSMVVLKLDTYQVKGWPKGSHRGTTACMQSLGQGHTIAVIGAEKDDQKEYVYYIDPGDSSDPSQARIVYKMSYEQFCSNAFDDIFASRVEPKNARYLPYGFS